jgi:predicted anti-sigma-YlaC factor YlaD
VSTQANKPIDLTCRDAYEFLLSYLEGELASEVRVAFDEHLEQCASCRRYVEQYKTVIVAVQAFESPSAALPSVPPALLGAIRSLRPVA